MRSWPAALFLALVLAGCGGSFTVTAMVARAARVPVRVFPQIAVVPGLEPGDGELALHVQDHLARRGRSEVLLIRQPELAVQRAAGQIPRTAVVLEVSARIIETSRPIFHTRPETVCNPWGGCSIVQRRVVDDMPVVVGYLSLLVTEGASGRELQSVHDEVRDEGSDPLSMRLRVESALRARATDLVDESDEEVRVELLEVDDQDVRVALLSIRDGDLARGRRLLDQVIASPRFRGLPAPVRARILFDAGQARRLDASDEQRLEHARGMLRAALELDPRHEYGRALEQVRVEWEERERIREQEAAADHNFRLLGAEPPAVRTLPSADVPTPPSSYQD